MSNDKVFVGIYDEDDEFEQQPALTIVLLPEEQAAHAAQILPGDIYFFVNVDTEVNLPHPGYDFIFTVLVSAASRKDAERVMTERIGPDEDYDFPYRIKWQRGGEWFVA